MGGTASGTILLVDDEDAVRRLCRIILQREGYTVLEAANGPAALELVAGVDGPIDAVVTDVAMPDMTGQQLADRLRNDRPGLRILFISGFTGDALIGQGIVEPGTAFLQKPFSPADLTTKLREVLDGGDSETRG